MKYIPRQVVNIVIILITVAAAIYYFNKHTYLLKDIAHINPLTGVLVLGLYILWLFALVIIFISTMNMVNFKMKIKENILLNSYSIFINFFVPGQAGTAYRAYYLKRNHGLKVRDYTVVTLTYYLLYGLLAIALMVIGSQAWWISVCLIVVLILLGIAASKLYILKFSKTHINFRLKNLAWVMLATLIQAVVQILIYFVELHSINHHIRLNQAVSYSGAANLALFVALTPAAIGIRESFLILSEKLHHVSTANIVLANVIDRSVFIVFLALIGLGILYLKFAKHTKKFNFSAKQSKKYDITDG